MPITKTYEVDGKKYSVEFDREPTEDEVTSTLTQLYEADKPTIQPPETTPPLPANVAGPQLAPPPPAATAKPQDTPKAIAPLSSYTPAESKQFIPTATPALQQAPQPTLEPVKQPVQGPEKKWTPETISAAAKAKFGKKPETSIGKAPSFQEASNVEIPIEKATADQTVVPKEKEKESAPRKPGLITGSLTSGAASGVSGLIKAPAIAWDFFAMLNNATNSGINKISKSIIGKDIVGKVPYAAPEEYQKYGAKYLDDIAQKNSFTNEYFKDQDMFSLMKEGKVGDAAKWIAAKVFETAPQVGAMALFPEQGLAALGASAAGSKAGELQTEDTKDEKTAKETKVLSAVSSGAFNTLFERLGTFKILERFGGAIKSFANKHGEEAAKKTFKDVIKNTFSAVLKDGGQEFAEESSNSIAEDITDKYLGVKPDLTWKDISVNAINNGVVGLASGGTMGAGRAAIETAASIPTTTEAPTKEPVKEAPPAATVSDKLPEADYKRTVPTKEQIDTKSYTAPTAEAATTTATETKTEPTTETATPITKEAVTPTIDSAKLRGDRTQTLAELNLTPEQVVALPQSERAAVLSSIGTKEAADIRKKVSASVVGQGLSSMGYTPEQFVKEWQETKVAPASLDKLPPEDVKSVLALVSAARQVTKEAEKKERDTQREIVAKEVAARKNIIAREVMRTTKGFGKLSKDELDIHKTRIANTVMEQDIKDALLNNIDKKIKKLARENRVNVGDKSKPIPAYTEPSSETVAPIAQEQTTAPIAEPIIRGSKTTETTPDETLSQPEVETIRDKFVAALPANIRNTITTAWAEDTPDVLAKMNENGFSAAAQRNDNGTTTVYFKKNASKNDIIPNAIEEVVGHHGVWELFKEDNEFKNLVNFLYKSDSKYSETNSYVESNYKDQIDKATTEEEKNAIRLDEWIAKKVVDYRTNKDARGIGKKVVDAITKAVKKLLVKAGIRKQDKVTIDRIVEAIHSRLQEGRSDAVTPARTQQWKQELGMPSEATIEANGGEVLRGAKKTDKQILADIERKARKIVEPKETAAKEKKVIQDEFTAELERYNNRDAVEAAEAAEELVLNEEPFLVEETFGDKFKRLMIDRFVWAKKVQERAEKILGRKFTEDESIWLRQKVSSAKIADRFNTLNTNFTIPLANVLKKNNISLEELGEYRTGLHIKEANERGKNIDPTKFDDEINPFFGMATSEGEAIKEKYAKDPRINGFKEANEIVSEMLQWKLDNMIASGLISEQVAEKWKEIYPNYVTAQGYDIDSLEESGLSDDAIDEIKESVEGKALGTGAKGFSVYEGWKARKGRTTKADINNAIPAMINGAQKAIVRSEKNQVTLALKSLYDALADTNNEYMEEITARELALIPDGKLADTHKFKPIPYISGALYSDAPIREKDTVIKGFKDGKPFFIKLKDPRLYRAMKWNKADYLNGFTKNMAKATDAIASVMTRRNILFPLTNVPRDVQAAAIRTSSLYGVKAGANFLRNWKPYDTAIAVRKYEAGQPMTSQFEKDVAEFMSLGGRVSSGQVETIEQISKRINFLNKSSDKAISEGRIGAAQEIAKTALRSGIKLMDFVNENSELMTRIAHFIAAKQAGVSPRQAAISARDVTVDFSQWGEISPAMNSLFAFWNASIISSAVVANTLFSKEGAVLGTALVTAGYMMAKNADDDDKDEFGKSEYEKQPLYNKTTKWYWHKNDDGTFVTTPMPYGFNILPALGALAYNVQKGYIGKPKAAYELALASRNSFIPVSGDGINILAPTVIKPVSEWVTNKNYRGQAIYNERKYGQALTPSWELAKKTTPKIYTNISRGLYEGTRGKVDITPELLPHFARGWMGPYIDEANKAMRRADKKEMKQEKSLSDYPILNKYVVPNTSDAHYSGEYYASKDVLDNFHRLRRQYESDREAMGASFKPYDELKVAMDTFNKSKLPILDREINALYRQRSALYKTKQWEDYKNKYGKVMPGYNTVYDKLNKKQAEYSVEFKKNKQAFEDLL